MSLEYGDWDEEAEAHLHAAADELDRLRVRVAWFDRYTPLGISPEWINAIAQDNDELRAVIENAPHANECPISLHDYFGDTPAKGIRCTCWKADAL